MTEQPLAQKLHLKAHTSFVLLNVPPEADAPLRACLPPAAHVIRIKNPREAQRAQALLAFAQNAVDIRDVVAPALRSFLPGGSADDEPLVWIAYPKKTGTLRTDISRDVGWEPVLAAGFQGVRQVALDATWSFLRFRHETRTTRRG